MKGIKQKQILIQRQREIAEWVGKVLHVPYLPKQNIADTSPEVKQKIWFFD